MVKVTNNCLTARQFCFKSGMRMYSHALSGIVSKRKGNPFGVFQILGRAMKDCEIVALFIG